MADREKVISGLKHHAKGRCKKDGDCCPYFDDRLCHIDLWNDALELLEDQEPKPPRIFQTVDKIFYGCDNCGKSLCVVADSSLARSSIDMPHYCPECGKAVKWG